MPAANEPECLVLHVDSERRFSGGEVQVFLLIDGLAARGWRNAIVCRAGSAVAAEARARGMATYFAPMRSDLDLPSIAALRGAIRASGAGLVHLHTGRATWLGSIAARLARVPAISTRRMDRAVGRGWRTRLVYDRLLRRVVAISPAVAELLREAGVAPSRIAMIASAVDAGRLRPHRSSADVRGELATPIDAPVLLVLASLVARKGVDVLFRAVHGLATEHGPVVWIAGDGPERPRLEGLAADLGIEPRVRFLGRRSDAADLLGACDVAVVPSRREGLGVAALEAMAASRPVVASAVGGLAEAVVDGRTGLLVPPDDPAALAGALAVLLEDAEARRRLGEAGARRVAEAFSAEQMVEAYAALYRAVLHE